MKHEWKAGDRAMVEIAKQSHNVIYLRGADQRAMRAAGALIAERAPKLPADPVAELVERAQRESHEQINHKRTELSPTAFTIARCWRWLAPL